jgi:phytoene dehydrogenase-like protein
MMERIERQIARFAPGFDDRVLARRVTSAAELERKNANLIGGLSPVGLMIYGKWSLDRH